jgi:prepilin-type N-terminal cleavage/methylation domain-containing protein
MKTQSPPASVRPRFARGFTLIELLIVISIIALLAALSMGLFSTAQERAARSRTTATLQAITSALERYKADNGEYPAPKNPGKTANVGGNNLTIGGAQMLYQAITGDGSDAIDLGTTQGKPSDGQIDDSEKKFTINVDFIPSKDATGNYRSKLNATMVVSGDFFLVDGFGHPFFYSRGDDPQSQSVNKGSFDVWSVAQSKNISTSFSLADKGNKDMTGPWIKNW